MDPPVTPVLSVSTALSVRLNVGFVIVCVHMFCDLSIKPSSKLGSVTRPLLFPIMENTYTLGLPLPLGYMIEVYGGQSNGPIRRGMTLRPPNENTGLADFWGCDFSIVFQPKIRDF